MPIYFFNESKINLPLKGKKILLKKFIQNLAKKENKKIENISLIFVTNKKIRELNKRFLNKDYNTDVIAFYYNSPNEPISGDIFISVSQVKKNAKKYNETFQNELLRIIIHGCLHLFGYKDYTDSERKIMTEKQENYLNEFLNILKKIK